MPTPLAFVIDDLEVGGAQRQLVELATRIDRTAFAPVVYEYGSSNFYREALLGKGVPVVRLPKAGSGPSIRVALRLTRELRRQRAALVHGFLTGANFYAASAARLLNVTTIASERSSLTGCQGRAKYERAIGFHLADFVTTNSVSSRSALTRDFHIPEDRTQVIRNGVDTKRFSPGVSPVRADLGIAPDTRVLLVPARIQELKNQLMLMRAWAEVPLTRRWLLLLVGSGLDTPYGQSVWAVAKDRGIQDRVRFVEAQKDIERWYQAADAVALPSIVEGFPNAILEAMACAKPVVASAVSDVPDLCAPESPGHSFAGLFDPTSVPSIVSALVDLDRLDGSKLQQMGTYARTKVVRSFSLDAMVTSYEALYQRVLARTSRNLGRTVA